MPTSTTSHAHPWTSPVSCTETADPFNGSLRVRGQRSVWSCRCSTRRASRSSDAPRPSPRFASCPSGGNGPRADVSPNAQTTALRRFSRKGELRHEYLENSHGRDGSRKDVRSDQPLHQDDQRRRDGRGERAASEDTRRKRAAPREGLQRRQAAARRHHDAAADSAGVAPRTGAVQFRSRGGRLVAGSKRRLQGEEGPLMKREKPLGKADLTIASWRMQKVARDAI